MVEASRIEKPNQIYRAQLASGMKPPARFLEMGVSRRGLSGWLFRSLIFLKLFLFVYFACFVVNSSASLWPKRSCRLPFTRGVQTPKDVHLEIEASRGGVTFHPGRTS